MILNTGGRTDTVQYFSQWLLNRFKEGYVLSRNPMFPHKITRYDLTPSKVDCVLFCSKNYEIILPRLKEITDRFNTYFHYTITAYGKDIEPGVPDIDKSIDTLYKLEKIVGKKRIAWRYDPVLLTKKYTKQQHLITFRHMAARLCGHIDRCIFSFVEMYKKLQYNMKELIPLTEEDIDYLAKGFGEIAREYNIYIQTCGTNQEFLNYGIHKSGCTTLDMLGRANNVQFKDLKHKGMRKGCACMVSHDIGSYDTCPNGCKYCYANTDAQKAQENYKMHDPESPLLLGYPTKDDVITHSKEGSFLFQKDMQMNLFSIE